MPDDPLALDAYNELADAYAAKVDTKAHNADYERPATLSLLPDVRGLNVLDAGCGPGVYAQWLADHGACVVGLDVSEKMLGHARTRVGDRALFHLASLDHPLDFLEAASFDVVLSALALDYVRDWRAAFGEFRRVLKPGGVFVFSLEHPNSSWRMGHAKNYFEQEIMRIDWRGFGPRVVVPSYRRPLQDVLNPLLEAGFRLDRMLEPLPQPAFKEKEPRSYEELCVAPGFMCIRAVAIP